MKAPASFLLAHEESTGVTTITLNRPQRLNALTFEVYGELRSTFDALSGTPEVRAIVLTGEGKAFCSGGDVHDIIGPLLSRDFQGLLEFTRMTGDLVRSIRACRQPVVAALNGTVAGAGAVIATACDIRIAASSAKIAFLFTKVGLSGADMGAAWLLPRIVGTGRADRAADDRRLHQRGGSFPNRSLQSRGRRRRAGGDRSGVCGAVGTRAVVRSRDHEGRA